MLLSLFAFLASTLFSSHAMQVINGVPIYDVCETKQTLLHYTDSQCFEITKPVNNVTTERFTLRAVLVTKQNEMALAKDKTSVVMIPGGPGESSELLRYYLNKKDMILGMIGYLNVNVIMFDPRGTGLSTFSKSVTEYGHESISNQQMVDDLLAVVNKISPNKPVDLMAHSSGGSVAAQFALQHPDRVAKMIFVSTSTSPREMAEIYLPQYAKENYQWTRFMQDPAHQALPLAELDQKYKKIEDVLVQQYKARVIGQYVNSDFQKTVRMSPLELRDQMVLASEQDPSGQAMVAIIEKYTSLISDVEKMSTQKLVPDELRQIKLSEANTKPMVLPEAEWIKAQIMCGEGMTADDLKTEIFLEGLTWSRYCAGLHAKDAASLVTTDLTKIKTPVLYFIGQKDIQIPAYLGRQIAQRLPNVQIVEDAQAGHAMFYEAPMTFYKAVDKFLSTP